MAPSLTTLAAIEPGRDTRCQEPTLQRPVDPLRDCKGLMVLSPRRLSTGDCGEWIPDNKPEMIYAGSCRSRVVFLHLYPCLFA